MRIAVLSDIHGNRAALEAVLNDVAGHDVDATVNLGDALSGPLDPAGCAEQLMQLDLPTVAGNHERQLLTKPRAEMSPSDSFAFDRLRAEHKRWIASFPTRLLLFGEVLLTHGTPASDMDYFLESVDEHGLRAASPEELETRAAGVAASLILCGHSHLPASRRLADGRLVVNPGAVGLQAYDAGWPRTHRVETGSPHARYALAEKQNGSWNVEFLEVVYDWEQEAERARQNGRPDWERALRTGRV